MSVQLMAWSCTVLLMAASAVAAEPIQPPPAASAQAPAEGPGTQGSDDDAGASEAAAAEDQDAGDDESNGRVRVYLDCFEFGPSSCFPEFLRERIDFVDFVRQPQDADVHLLASGQETGGGGRELVLRFVGRGRFAGHDHDLKAITGVSDTENTRREVILRTVLVGLLDYVAQDGIPPGVRIEVETEGTQRERVQAEDPWNLWVFSVQLDGSYESDERSSEREWEMELGADRVTERWKMTFGARLNHSREHFELEDGDELDVVRRDRRVSGFAARSLGPHWSAGLRGRVSSSTFDNEELAVLFSPAVEYSLFPYEQYATRQLIFQYSVGPQWQRYSEETIFRKLRETLVQHRVLASLDQREPWGSLSASFEFEQYLHDLSKYSLEGYGDVNLRIARGLSLNLSGSASRIRDQLSLPLRDASDEEVLLRLRQLESGYEFEFRFGVTYSFGSLFNNVVNPRFGD